jgi:hypothetical protein
MRVSVILFGWSKAYPSREGGLAHVEPRHRPICLSTEHRKDKMSRFLLEAVNGCLLIRGILELLASALIVD